MIIGQIHYMIGRKYYWITNTEFFGKLLTIYSLNLIAALENKIFIK
jgi:hypothetical protein